LQCRPANVRQCGSSTSATSPAGAPRLLGPFSGAKGTGGASRERHPASLYEAEFQSGPKPDPCPTRKTPKRSPFDVPTVGVGGRDGTSAATQWAVCFTNRPRGMAV